MRYPNVCIIGMGYVGLTLAVTLVEAGFQVWGVEANKAVTRQLNKGKPHFHEKRLPYLLRKGLGQGLTISNHMPRKQFDAFVICVGTPLDDATQKPVLKYLVNACKQVTSRLVEGNLVVIRSTVPMGSTRKMIKPILDQQGKKYFLAFCPERTAEGNALNELRELPQVVGGLDAGSVDKAIDLFRPITKTIIDVSSVEAAEMIKLTNNAYRDLNFAYANQVALICERFGLDPQEVVRAANLGYARSNIPVPGFVGGVCLNKDPHILAEASGKSGALIRQARVLNESLPLYVARKIGACLAIGAGKKAGKKLFITGFAFKGQPETSDVRGSPAVAMLKHLKKMGYTRIYGHDFVVGKKAIRALGANPVTLAEGFRKADCVVIANNHPAYAALDVHKLAKKMRPNGLVMDCWRLFDSNEVKKAGQRYGGIGLG